ncbi:branched-chain amino acid ABC transporter permease [Brassicibacter mesophilus]|uniref:branched-chain amino acid ABC transporter permease n=1 Tax=Brassicibacter mesophilus TaxID=745119 RepID=UPI003D2456B3
MNTKKLKYTLISLVVFIVFLILANLFMNQYQLRILNLCAIYVILGLSLNLVNGFTGLFVLGHAGFMAVGAYTTALLTLSPEMKASNFFIKPIIAPLATIQLPFPIALLVAGLMAAIAGFIIGAPALKLKDDYLAIATLGFAEIIRVVFTNTQSITNGALGLKGVPVLTNIWWSWGLAILTILFVVRIVKSSYGNAFRAIRDDDIAAQAMGVNLFKHKVISFMIGAFLAGVGGGLLGNLLGTVDPNMFRFLLTFQILLIVVLGGSGSITGTVISAIVVTVGMEALRVLDQDINLGFTVIPGISGMRMVIFSALLLIVILFYQQGLMGNREFSWDYIDIVKIKLRKLIKKDVEA